MTQHKDPIDHARTTRPRAGLVMADGRELPGLVLLGLALAALVASLTTAVKGSAGWAIGLGVATLVIAAAGVVAMLAERRRTTRRTAGSDEE